MSNEMKRYTKRHLNSHRVAAGKRALFFDEDYTGPRWTYGLRFRPLGIGAQPKGFIVGSLRDHPEYRHGALDYPRPLTEHEEKSYELEFIGSTGEVIE